jgi:two-component system, cell cycle sensor histidine kinase and response regulator CckA
MPPQDKTRVLYVDDSPFDRALVRDALEVESQGFELREAGTRKELDTILARKEPFDLILSDFNILGMTGLDVLRLTRQAMPGIPVIIVTGTGSEEIAVQALKEGADDYVIKQPHHIRRLPQTIQAILEKRRMEQALEESQEELRRLRHLEAVGRLAGGIAHDFNNLITVITGNADFLASELPPDSAQASEVHEIRKAGRRAQELTRQLMEFSSGEVTPLESVNISALLEETMPLARSALGPGVKLTSRLAPELPQVRSNYARLQQVVLNIVLNARDAIRKSGDKGTVTVSADLWPSPRSSGRVLSMTRAQTEEPSGEELETLIRIRIHDDGCGMSPEIMERVFEPFYTTKVMGRGTGLGLASSFGTVRQAGGTIQVESQPGMGSTFTILLPAQGG